MRILAVDYGEKRCGLAWTDPEQIIATPLPPCARTELFQQIQAYCRAEAVDTIVLGWPMRLDTRPTHITAAVEALAEQLRKAYPDTTVALQDERLTSRMASRAMVEGGARKSIRRKKEVVNSVSAALILQAYLQQRTHSGNESDGSRTDSNR